MASFFGGVASELSDSWDFTKRDFGVILAIIAVGCGISAFIVLYFALRHLWQVAKSRILQKSTHTFIITLIVSVMLGVILSALINEIFFLIIFGGFIYCFILRYRVYKEVAYITNQPLFMWAFWLSIVAVIVNVFAKHYGFLPISIALDLIVVIIYIIAWIKAKEIRLSKSAENIKE